MARIRAGQLRHRIRLERVTTTQDAAGGLEESWECYKIARARIEAGRGSERVEAEAVQANVTHTITVRWFRERPKPRDRVRFDGRIFNIEAVINPGEANVVYELAVTEVVDGC